MTTEVSSLDMLTNSNILQINAVGNALKELLSNTFSENEKKAIIQIEQRRKQLLETDDLIEVVDYGAGNKNSIRDKEDQFRGVVFNKKVSEICNASKPPFWAMFLFKLVKHLKPSTCVELGTCVGISAAYQTSALELNEKGHLFTLEGATQIADVAKHTLANLKLARATVVTGPFHQTLIDVLSNNKPIDYFFNDGHHDHDAVLAYLDQSAPFLAENAVIVFDDIAWSKGMSDAWQSIQNDQRVRASVDLGVIGIAVFNTKKSANEHSQNYKIVIKS